jgi:hypothetical protein
MPRIREDLTSIAPLGFNIWQLIIPPCFGHCQQFKYNIFWDGDLVFDPATKTFMFATNLYAKLRHVSRCMYHVVYQLWKNPRGLFIAPQLILARHQLNEDFRTIAKLTVSYFNITKDAGSSYEMSTLKRYMQDNRVADLVGSNDAAEDFWPRLNTEMLYNGVAVFFNQTTRTNDAANIMASNQLGQLLIYGFFRSADSDYQAGGLRNSDDSVQLIFSVLKRILLRGRLMPAWTWTRSLHLLFEYAPHVEQWKRMQGFRMFYYLMHQNTDGPTWELFSQCIYYAASEMEETTVIFVDSNEFGELLTDLLNKIAPIWQDNIAMLLSIARLLATWRLQHPQLEPPVTMDLETVIKSPLSLETMQPRILQQPTRPLSLDADGFMQDDAGYLYPESDDLVDNDDLCTIESGFFHILHTGEVVDTPEFHLQVFNSFVLWLLSRFPAEQLCVYAEEIRHRMHIWECDGDGCHGEDEPYITELKQKLH